LGAFLIIKTIIPLALVGFEMIISTISYPTWIVVNWRALSRHGVPRVKLENEHVHTNSIATSVVGGDL